MNKINYNQLAAFINVNREFYFKLAFSYVHNNSEALLVIQASINKAYSTMKGLYNPLAIKSWFYKIVVDISIDYLNDKKRFIIVKPAEYVTIPKELEVLVKQNIEEAEKKIVRKRSIIIRTLIIAAALIIILFLYILTQFLL